MRNLKRLSLVCLIVPHVYVVAMAGSGVDGLALFVVCSYWLALSAELAHKGQIWSK